jgi:exonuclease III
MTIVTWNMQGGGFATDTNKAPLLNKFFTKDGGYHDVICIQEATAPLPYFDNKVAETDGIEVFKPSPAQPGQRHSPRFPVSADDPGIHNYICYYYRWGDKNPRCSLATYVKKGLYGFDVDYGIIPPQSNGAVRPTLWIRVPAADMTVANIHLPSGRPGFALKIFLDIQAEILKKLKTSRYAIIGDFNIPVTDLNSRPDAKYFQAIKGPTQQSGNTLDYIYYEKGEVRFEGADKESAGSVPSDHQFLIITVP